MIAVRVKSSRMTLLLVYFAGRVSIDKLQINIAPKDHVHVNGRKIKICSLDLVNPSF